MMWTAAVQSSTTSAIKPMSDTPLKSFASHRSILPTLALGFLVLALTACTRSSVNDQPAGAVAPSQSTPDLTGIWVQVGQPGRVGQIPAVGGRYKFRTSRHWTLTHANPTTGLVVEHFGGAYTLNGNEYVETIEYGGTNDVNDFGQSFRFNVRVEGDTMTQIGIGNPYNEVWQRVK